MSMDKGSELILAEILKKSPEKIDQFDLDFLVARRGYLSDAQCEAYGVNEEVARKEREAAKALENSQEEEAPAEITTYTMPQLLKAAEEKGVQVPEDATREEVIALLQGKPAEESADAPAPVASKPKAKTTAKKTASKPKAKK